MKDHHKPGPRRRPRREQIDMRQGLVLAFEHTLNPYHKRGQPSQRPLCGDCGEQKGNLATGKCWDCRRKEGE